MNSGTPASVARDDEVDEHADGGVLVRGEELPLVAARRRRRGRARRRRVLVRLLGLGGRPRHRGGRHRRQQRKRAAPRHLQSRNPRSRNPQAAIRNTIFHIVP